MACSLREKGERWLSRDTLILPSSCTKSAGEPNFADDLINPPEVGILEREIKRVKKGRAVAIPAGKEAVGPRVIARP